LRAEGSSCNFDALYGGLGISKLQFLKKLKKISAVNFFQFGHQPWIRIELKCRIQIRIELKCRIQIRIETNADLKQ
jgi:hypothetical protein